MNSILNIWYVVFYCNTVLVFYDILSLAKRILRKFPFIWVVNIVMFDVACNTNTHSLTCTNTNNSKIMVVCERGLERTKYRPHVYLYIIHNKCIERVIASLYVTYHLFSLHIFFFYRNLLYNTYFFFFRSNTYNSRTGSGNKTTLLAYVMCTRPSCYSIAFVRSGNQRVFFQFT